MEGPPDTPHQPCKAGPEKPFSGARYRKVASKSIREAHGKPVIHHHHPIEAAVVRAERLGSNFLRQLGILFHTLLLAKAVRHMNFLAFPPLYAFT